MSVGTWGGLSFRPSQAPTQVPLYVTAVVVAHGGSGSRCAAPIARDILLEAQGRDSAGDKLKDI